MTKRYCAWGVDSSYRFKFMADIASWRFKRSMELLANSKSTTLKQHIETNYNGNTAAFARDVGTSHTQATRWLQMDCLWLDGQVWKQQSQFKPANL